MLCRSSWRIRRISKASRCVRSAPGPSSRETPRCTPTTAWFTSIVSMKRTGRTIPPCRYDFGGARGGHAMVRLTFAAFARVLAMVTPVAAQNDGDVRYSGKIVEVRDDGRTLVLEEMLAREGPDRPGIVHRSITITPQTSIRLVERTSEWARRASRCPAGTPSGSTPKNSARARARARSRSRSSVRVADVGGGRGSRAPPRGGLASRLRCRTSRARRATGGSSSCRHESPPAHRQDATAAPMTSWTRPHVAHSAWL